MRRRFIIAVALLAVGALSGVAAYEHAGSGTGDWREIGWPFPRDGWPAGRAFRRDGWAVTHFLPSPLVGERRCEAPDEGSLSAETDLPTSRGRRACLPSPRPACIMAGSFPSSVPHVPASLSRLCRRLHCAGAA